MQTKHVFQMDQRWTNKMPSGYIYSINSYLFISSESISSILPRADFVYTMRGKAMRFSIKLPDGGLAKSGVTDGWPDLRE